MQLSDHFQRGIVRRLVAPLDISPLNDKPAGGLADTGLASHHANARNHHNPRTLLGEPRKVEAGAFVREMFGPALPPIGGGSTRAYFVAGAIGACSSSPDNSPNTASKSLASRKFRYTEANRT
jgi:hypothetical protein